MRKNSVLLLAVILLSPTLGRAAALSQPLRATVLGGVSSPLLVPSLTLRGLTAPALSPTLSFALTPALTLAAPALVAPQVAFIPAPIILAHAVIALPAPQSALFARASSEADFFKTSWRSLSFKKGGKGKMPDPKSAPDGNGTGESQEGPLDPLGNPSRTTDDGPDTVSDEFPSRGDNGAP